LNRATDDATDLFSTYVSLLDPSITITFPRSCSPMPGSRPPSNPYRISNAILYIYCGRRDCISQIADFLPPLTRHGLERLFLPKSYGIRVPSFFCVRLRGQTLSPSALLFFSPFIADVSVQVPLRGGRFGVWHTTRSTFLKITSPTLSGSPFLLFGFFFGHESSPQDSCGITPYEPVLRIRE